MKRISSSWGTLGSVCRFNLPKVQLEITRGLAKLETREVHAAAFLIGAAADCDWVLDDLQFAEVHSYLFLSPQRVTVRHLGFGPGLCVAGQDVTWAALHHNDQLRIGPYEFRVRIQWPEGGSGNGGSLLDPLGRWQVSASHEHGASPRMPRVACRPSHAAPYLNLHLKTQKISVL